MNSKQFYDDAYRIGHPTNYAGTDADNHERASALRKRLDKWLPRVSNEAKVLEVGCGLGLLHGSHPQWRGVEYSASAVARAGRIPIVEGDARNLPVESASIDFLFTFATLEHVPEVEKAFVEIDRALRPGGIALIAPAWNCRPWTVKKLQIRPYSELDLTDKMAKALIPLRENLLFRATCSLPGRLLREATLLMRLNLELQYKRLHPDLSLNDRYPHISDDDAFVSMDAHSALTWFRQRDYECLSHPGRMDRFLVRGEEIVVRKKLK